MGNTFSQMWPPAPAFTEENVPDQHGKVFIITGATSGVGRELARFLFLRNATVYVAGRNEGKAVETMSHIHSALPQSRGQLNFLPVDLEDLRSVQLAAAAFLKKETRLDALWNNAGVMQPPDGSRTKQGFELQLGVNCLASFLLVKLLTPIMIQTVRDSKPGSVRVLWVASSAAELFSPLGGGIDMDNLDYKTPVPSRRKYAASKAGMALLSQEFARRHKEDGVVSVAMNPGNLKTDLRRFLSWPVATVFGWISWDPVYGAYTELFAGFSDSITLADSGCWVIPWGRITPIRQDIHDAGMSDSEGVKGLGSKFWDWCEKQVEPFRA
ncbi:NAD(P)-binding protein [Thozetella sp. PMI_491]|nr:NAD(P)-binding protein [Thozetella sp. PMI_491]